MPGVACASSLEQEVNLLDWRALDAEVGWTLTAMQMDQQGVRPLRWRRNFDGRQPGWTKTFESIRTFPKMCRQQA